jgi:hypothetical protein
MSSNVARHAGCFGDVGPLISFNVRGVDEPLEVIGLARGRDLPASGDGRAMSRPGREGPRPRRRAYAFAIALTGSEPIGLTMVMRHR